jgi:quercetin dioxygenase-like cupin family protein
MERLLGCHRVDAEAGKLRDSRITRRRALAGSLALMAATPVAAPRTGIAPLQQRTEAMEIRRNGSQPSRKGSEEYFTGKVRIDPLFESPAPARVSCGCVTFDPGARSAWHTHPLGQTLIVTSGVGWTQCWGGPIEEIRPGDVIWCPPGVKHWHGASPTTAMTHIAVQERDVDGKVVDWLEKVTDEQYRAGPKPA